MNLYGFSFLKAKQFLFVCFINAAVNAADSALLHEPIGGILRSKHAVFSVSNGATLHCSVPGLCLAV